MSSVPLNFLPEAAAEASEATSYYEECSQGLGVRFRLEVESICAAIAEHPLLWQGAMEDTEE